LINVKNVILQREEGVKDDDMDEFNFTLLHSF
jgi:hypothetical protein